MEKIKIHSEVDAIRRHFQQIALDRIFKKIYNMRWPSTDRSAKTYEAEDHGFAVATRMVLEILTNELSKTGVDNS